MLATIVSRLLRLLPVCAFLMSVPAFAQFEINPDHFDDVTTKQPAQHTAVKKARTATSSTITSRSRTATATIHKQKAGQQVASSQPLHPRKTKHHAAVSRRVVARKKTVNPTVDN